MTVLGVSTGTLEAAGMDVHGDVVGTLSADTCCASSVFLYVAAQGAVQFPFPDRQSARGDAISASGLLVVTLDDGRSYRWDGSRLDPVGAMTPSAVNDAGAVVGVAQLGAGPLHAAVDEGGVVSDLDPAHPDQQSAATGVNASGTIVGVRLGKAVVFEPSGPVELGVAAGSIALDVSDTGLVVGSAGRTDQLPAQAFLADVGKGTITLVDPLPGDTGVELRRVNRSGTIAIGTSFGTTTTPVIYQNGSLRPFSGFVLPVGWDLLEAVDVNDAGQLLVTLRDDQGRGRPAILTPR
jgi:uncharacterized membrane protein